MTKEELKALGLTDEQVGKVIEDYGKNYVSKAQFNEKNDKLKESKVIAAKYSEIVKTLGLEEDDQTIESAQNLKEQIDALKKTGKKPDELTAQVEKLNKALADMQKTSEAEKAKRILATKTNAALAALQKGNALNPEAMTKLIIDNITVKEDDSMIFTLDDKEHDVNAGIAEWLKVNPWAVKNTGVAGAGTGSSNRMQKPTKEEFAKMNYGERAKLFSEDEALYKELTKN